jgi:DNA-binding transcriptional regulator YiaG
MTPREARHMLGLSQEQMAHLLGGTSLFTVAKWEQGHRVPSAHVRNLIDLLVWLYKEEPDVYHRWLSIYGKRAFL